MTCLRPDTCVICVVRLLLGRGAVIPARAGGHQHQVNAPSPPPPPFDPLSASAVPLSLCDQGGLYEREGREPRPDLRGGVHGHDGLRRGSAGRL